jgi:hypothetical protein
MPPGFGLCGMWTDMTATSEPKAATMQPRPNMKFTTSAKPRRPQFRKPKPSASQRPDARPSPNAQKSYERYLALAQAEALRGDRIAAENYLQHAEHYLRSMRDSRATADSPAGQYVHSDRPPRGD